MTLRGLQEAWVPFPRAVGDEGVVEAGDEGAEAVRYEEVEAGDGVEE